MTEQGAAGIAVVGGGSWGTAFAAAQAKRYGEVLLWVREEEVCAMIRESRENRVFLPGIPVPAEVRPTTSLQEALAGRSIVAFAVPSHHLRSVVEAAAPYLAPEASLVSLAKGLENESLLRMTEVLGQAAPGHADRVAVLSGPTFAREIAAGRPAGAVVASSDPRLAVRLQEALSGNRFRLYAGTDVTGVELGGALKNIMAIAAGMADGLAFGHNARALLISRGLAEITRVGVRLGADPRTFQGLSGLGDLVLTCTGDLSRNRTVGIRIGQGAAVDKILGGMQMVAEGVRTSRAAVDLAKRTGMAMPVSDQVYRILYEGKEVREAVSELFARALRMEPE